MIRVNVLPSMKMLAIVFTILTFDGVKDSWAQSTTPGRSVDDRTSNSGHSAPMHEVSQQAEFERLTREAQWINEEADILNKLRAWLNTEFRSMEIWVSGSGENESRRFRSDKNNTRTNRFIEYRDSHKSRNAALNARSVRYDRDLEEFYRFHNWQSDPTARLGGPRRVVKQYADGTTTFVESAPQPSAAMEAAETYVPFSLSERKWLRLP